MEPDRGALATKIAWGQGAYFLLTGIWPLFGMRSFERITGPKRDRWLVKTVGGLVAVVGGALILAAWRRPAAVTDERELPLVAVGSAATLAAVDVVYVARGRIAPIYLLDALAEAICLAAWGMARLRRR